MRAGWGSTEDGSAPRGGGRYVRAPRVLWRNAPDRVLVRRVGFGPLELTGVAAFVWCSLDEPCTATEVERDLEASTDRPRHELRVALRTALDRLLDHGVICEVP